MCETKRHRNDSIEAPKMPKISCTFGDYRTPKSGTAEIQQQNRKIKCRGLEACSKL